MRRVSLILQWVSDFPLASYLSYLVFLNLNLVNTHANGHFRRYMLKHTKHQVRYYKSQLYNVFVISDVCNRSLCVIPYHSL